jgi:hypothetical protein
MSPTMEFEVGRPREPPHYDFDDLPTPTVGYTRLLAEEISDIDLVFSPLFIFMDLASRYLCRLSRGGGCTQVPVLAPTGRTSCSPAYVVVWRDPAPAKPTVVRRSWPRISCSCKGSIEVQ